MIDHERLKELEADFGMEELSGIIATFLDEARDAVAALGVAGSDPVAKRERLHFLKGCARMVGARRLGDLCSQMEVQPAFGPQDHARLERELRALRDAFHLTCLPERKAT